MSKVGSGIGVLSGLVASLCCIGPLVIVLIGLGPLLGISGMCLKEYRLIFFSLGLTTLFSGIYILLRRKEGTCDIDAVSKNRKIVIFAIGVMSITYISMIFYIVPFLKHQFISELTCRMLGGL